LSLRITWPTWNVRCRQGPEQPESQSRAHAGTTRAIVTRPSVPGHFPHRHRAPSTASETSCCEAVGMVQMRTSVLAHAGQSPAAVLAGSAGSGNATGGAGSRGSGQRPAGRVAGRAGRSQRPGVPVTGEGCRGSPAVRRGSSGPIRWGRRRCPRLWEGTLTATTLSLRDSAVCGTGERRRRIRACRGSLRGLVLMSAGA
jgi:hypothetical protein